MNQESRITNMNEEFYHKDIFGTVVDIDLSELVSEEDLIGKKKAIDFNIFLLTDAFAARKKRDAWVLYQKALVAGFVSEEVFYKLFWQIKTMLLASKTKSAKEADMKDYPYNKAKGYLKIWQKVELEKFSENLVTGYHKVRRGEGEMETFVEKTILSV